MTEKHLVIATRESQLALWQAQYIQQRLMTLFPELTVSLLGLTTKGDQILDRSLSKIGGKGLFVKELEVALADGRADLAVHSMKDVPMQLPEGFALAAICEREDPTDAFVSNHYAQLADLPAGAIVGTSSLRREAQVRRHYPHLQVKPLRGNLQTRLGKLDKGEFDAIILASSGLKRLGLAERIRMPLALNDSLPSPGQGALGIEIASHRSDLLPYLTVLNHAETRACVEAERTLSRILGGSCQVPIAGFAQMEQGQLSLKGLVASVDGQHLVQAQAQGLPDQAETIGQQVAAALIEQGAQGLIDQALSQAKAE